MIRTALDDWFVAEILPHEAALVRFLRRNWRDQNEISDLCQEVYLRIYESAGHSRPLLVRPFVFTVARNLLIDRARRAQVVAIDTVADLSEIALSIDELTPERHATGRSELRLLQTALEMLPDRCRQVVALRKIEGLSQREVAAHMGITEDTVERQISHGMRALAAALLLKGVQTGMARYVKSLKKGAQTS